MGQLQWCCHQKVKNKFVPGSVLGTPQLFRMSSGGTPHTEALTAH